MHGTRLYEAERSKRLTEWEHISKLIKKCQRQDVSHYANVSVVAYGKKPQYRRDSNLVKY